MGNTGMEEMLGMGQSRMSWRKLEAAEQYYRQFQGEQKTGSCGAMLQAIPGRAPLDGTFLGGCFDVQVYRTGGFCKRDPFGEVLFQARFLRSEISLPAFFEAHSVHGCAC